MKGLIYIVIVLFTSTVYGQYDSQNTTLLGHWAKGECNAVKVENEVAYIGNGATLDIVNISDPSNPVNISSVTFPDVIYDIAYNDNYETHETQI